MSLRGTSCCGIMEYVGVNGVRKTSFDGIIKSYESSSKRFGFIIFSCNDAEGADNDGEFLAKQLEEHGLGVVTRTAPTVNPNTTRTIKHFAWRIDHEAMAKFCSEFFAEERREAKEAVENRKKIVKENMEKYHVRDIVVINKGRRKDVFGENDFGDRVCVIVDMTEMGVSLGFIPGGMSGLADASKINGSNWNYYPWELQYLDIIDPETGKVKTSAPKTVKRRLKKIL